MRPKVPAPVCTQRFLQHSEVHPSEGEVHYPKGVGV
jgi:hypothetical protein